MNLHSHILKLTGSAELSGPLEMGKRYAVGVEVGITDKRDHDNQDGTYDLEYTVLSRIRFGPPVII